MTFKDRLNAFLRRLTYGKYGYDEMSRFLTAAALLPVILAVCTAGVGKGHLSAAFYLAAMVTLLWACWRAFSRDIAARRRENERFLQSRFYVSLRDAAIRYSQRREYCFFRCPECRKRLRVPRGKGGIEITCPACGKCFRRKT